MNLFARKVALLFFSFIVLVGQILLSNAISSSTNAIPTLGVIKQQTILKHQVVYPYAFDDESAGFTASHFSLVVVDFVATKGFERIKTFNPKVILLGYRDIIAMHTGYEDWAQVNAHEDWFLHDVNGERLVEKNLGWYAMDVGNPGWRDHYAQSVKAKLDANPLIDGLFADDVWHSRNFDRPYWTVSLSQVPVAEIKARWDADMVGMLQHVKSVLGNKLVIINTSDWRTLYWVDGVGWVPSPNFVNYVDGMMMEGFIHGTWEDLDDFMQDPFYQLEALTARSATERYVLTLSGAKIPDNPTQTDLEMAHKVMLYCLGSAMLSLNGSRVSFGWLMLHAAPDGSQGYYPEMDCYMGAPKGNYLVKDGLHMRAFEYGWVLVNFSTDTRSTVIEGVTYILEQHSAIIIGK